MKKLITVSSLFLGVVFLSGCSQQQVSQTQSITPVAQNPTINKTATTSVEKKVATDFNCGKSQVKDASGIAYGTVVAEDKKCWLDRNLGATEVAKSATDKASYGWYFQWGRGADGHQIPTSSTTTELSASDNPKHAKFIASTGFVLDWRSPQNDNLWQGVNGVNNPCPTGFRLPTSDEWTSLVSDAKIKDTVTAFNSSLKLTPADSRYFTDGTLGYQGRTGNYWSSSPTSTFAGNIADNLYFDASVIYPSNSSNRAYGYSVRCLKD